MCAFLDDKGILLQIFIRDQNSRYWYHSFIHRNYTQSKSQLYTKELYPVKLVLDLYMRKLS